MIRYFFIYLGIINLIAFGLFAVDKKRAVHNGEIEKAKRRRKPEPVRTMKRGKHRRDGGNVAPPTQDQTLVFCLRNARNSAAAAADRMDRGQKNLILYSLDELSIEI